MSYRPVIDAGPALNFFALNRERLLISVLGPLTTPETVHGEILHKARTDQRFVSAEAVLKKLGTKYLEILSDDITDALNTAVNRICGMPMAHRMTTPRDLGELMVVSHAAVAAESGLDVVVLIDETKGAGLAASEQRRLDRLRGRGRSVGSMKLVNTPTVLAAGAGTQHIPERGAMRDLYSRMRKLDDGLVPIEKTDLLSPQLWPGGLA